MRGQRDHVRWPLIFLSVFLQVIFGLAADPSSESKSSSPSSSGKSTKLEALYIIIGIVAVILLAVGLFKFWQKKKREEQHARLLRLFEEDDELELELGLRD